MELSYNDLRKKEVVNTLDGKSWGGSAISCSVIPRTVFLALLCLGAAPLA